MNVYPPLDPIAATLGEMTMPFRMLSTNVTDTELRNEIQNVVDELKPENCDYPVNASPTLFSVRGDEPKRINFLGFDPDNFEIFESTALNLVKNRKTRLEAFGQLKRSLRASHLPTSPVDQILLAVRSLQSYKCVLTPMHVIRDVALSQIGVARNFDFNTGERFNSIRILNKNIEGDQYVEQPGNQPWSERLENVLDIITNIDYRPLELYFEVLNDSLIVFDWERIALSNYGKCFHTLECLRLGLANEVEALSTVQIGDYLDLDEDNFESIASSSILGGGLGVSRGRATGIAVFRPEQVAHYSSLQVNTVLILNESRPEDLQAISLAAATVMLRGGVTSHAAVVARSLGSPCIVALSDSTLDASIGQLRIGTSTVTEGDIVTVDGGRGILIRGHVNSIPNLEVDRSRLTLQKSLLMLADRHRTLEVWANADTAEDALASRRNGAQGVGLCRTEHMFLGSRKSLLQDLLLSPSGADTRLRLSEIGSKQRHDFKGILASMNGMPVCIRLFDPPRHEFLPSLLDLSVRSAISKYQGGESEEEQFQLQRTMQMTESNPMLGVRGVRLGILIPMIYDMQIRALLEAIVECRRDGLNPNARVLLPMVVDVAEIVSVRERLKRSIAYWTEILNSEVRLPMGVMIETPRAALTAAVIAPEVDFMSFGTNDLTQFVWGMSRDDIDIELLPRYIRRGILRESPFLSIDELGVGALMKYAISEVRRVTPQMSIGICGEHAADPKSINFFSQLDITYLSCSPPLISSTRYGAGRAAVTNSGVGAYGSRQDPNDSIVSI